MQPLLIEKVMDIGISRHGSHASIMLPQRFDFNCLNDFRRAYSGLVKDESISTIEIDCAQLQFIDSSGIGLLLLLHEKIEAGRQSVSVTNCDPRIRKIFAIANINKLFHMA